MYHWCWGMFCAGRGSGDKPCTAERHGEVVGLLRGTCDGLQVGWPIETVLVLSAVSGVHQ